MKHDGLDPTSSNFQIQMIIINKIEIMCLMCTQHFHWVAEIQLKLSIVDEQTEEKQPTTTPTSNTRAA